VAQLAKIFAQEDVNFLLSNRIPRRLATRLMGRLGKIESPLLTRAAIAAWKAFGDLDLRDTEQQRFASIHACFTRALRQGARPVDADPALMTSPCDAIVGASGHIAGDELLQVKGFHYRLSELLVDPALAEHYRDGQFVTLRLT